MRRTNLSKKLRKSQRRKLRRKKKNFRILRQTTVFFIIVALISVVGYIAYMSVTTGMFGVSEIQVEGTEILTNDQIVEASGIQEGENIFLLNLNNIRFNINKVVSAKNIYIRKVLPNKIIISIEENQPIGIFSQEGQNYYIDSDGRLMEITEELGKDDTPILSGFSKVEFGDTGQKVNVEPNYKFEQILNMLKLFEQNNLLGQLSEISLTKDNNYRIITKRGVVFTVKNFSNLQEYFNYVSSVIENGEMNQDINFAIGNNPIKKPR